MNLENIIRHLPELFGALFVTVLFLQSSLDKIFDWKGNMEWLTGHFSKTFLSPFVWIMLAKLTVLELATGLLNAVGIVYLVLYGSTIVIFYGASLGALTLIGLFFGQRIAKDYPGAAVLVPYFLLMIALVYLTTPARYGVDL